MQSKRSNWHEKSFFKALKIVHQINSWLQTIENTFSCVNNIFNHIWARFKLFCKTKKKYRNISKILIENCAEGKSILNTILWYISYKMWKLSTRASNSVLNGIWIENFVNKTSLTNFRQRQSFISLAILPIISKQFFNLNLN